MIPRLVGTWALDGTMMEGDARELCGEGMGPYLSA
jgi:hypothetical protein